MNKYKEFEGVLEDFYEKFPEFQEKFAMKDLYTPITDNKDFLKFWDEIKSDEVDLI